MTVHTTPPTPDPRERGEALASLERTIHTYRKAWEEAKAELAALRAPAPSEAVAWQLVHTRTGQRWTPATDRASVENQQREFAALGATETRIAALVDTHPAPARGVTVTEAMVEEQAQIVYAAMQNTVPDAKQYPWVAGGNSVAQGESRRAARAILAAAFEYVTGLVEGMRVSQPFVECQSCTELHSCANGHHVLSHNVLAYNAALDAVQAKLLEAK